MLYLGTMTEHSFDTITPVSGEVVLDGTGLPWLRMSTGMLVALGIEQADALVVKHGSFSDRLRLHGDDTATVDGSQVFAFDQWIDEVASKETAVARPEDFGLSDAEVEEAADAFYELQRADAEAEEAFMLSTWRNSA